MCGRKLWAPFQPCRFLDFAQNASSCLRKGPVGQAYSMYSRGVGSSSDGSCTCASSQSLASWADLCPVEANAFSLVRILKRLNEIKTLEITQEQDWLTFVGIMTYALCFGKPICSSVCMGVRCCLVDILVGVGFFLGGRAAAAIVNKVLNKSPHKQNSLLASRDHKHRTQNRNKTDDNRPLHGVLKRSKHYNKISPNVIFVPKRKMDFFTAK